MKAVRTAATILGVLVVGVLVLELVIHGWNGQRLHDGVHERRGRPASSTENNTLSQASSRSSERATGHMPPWHHGLIHGTKGDDVLYGTESGERIEGLSGRDKIIARGGDDVLDGGPDDDILMGGLGDDTYVLQHHGGGPDIIIEEGGTDTLQFVGGRIAWASIEILRHGNDLLIRWNHNNPADTVTIRSWFAGPQFHVERLQLPDGTIVPLEPLAERARPATAEDLIHASPSGSTTDRISPQ